MSGAFEWSLWDTENHRLLQPPGTEEPRPRAETQPEHGGTPRFSLRHTQKAPISATVRGSCSSGTQLVLHFPDICIIHKLAS